MMMETRFQLMVKDPIDTCIHTDVSSSLHLLYGDATT